MRNLSEQALIPLKWHRFSKCWVFSLEDMGHIRKLIQDWRSSVAVRLKSSCLISLFNTFIEEQKQRGQDSGFTLELSLNWSDVLFTVNKSSILLISDLCLCLKRRLIFPLTINNHHFNTYSSFNWHSSAQINKWSFIDVKLWGRGADKYTKGASH